MKFLYVDESGDPGISAGSPSRYFILAGLIIDAADLQEFTTALHRFRQHLSAKYGLLISEEVHASVFISSPDALKRISFNDRLRILLECLDWCRRRPDAHLLTVAIDKHQATTNSVFQDAWRQLLLSFDAHLSQAGLHNTPTQGLVFCDNTDGPKLSNVMHSLQQPATTLTGSQPATHHIIGNYNPQDSRSPYLLQLADVVAYFATQLYLPNKRIRRSGAHNYFKRLSSINLLINSYPNGIMLL